MPTAVFRANNPQKMIEETIVIAEDTHPDPRCIYSCLCINQLISDGIRGVSKQDSYDSLVKEFGSINKEFTNILIQAADLPWQEWNNGGFTNETVKCAIAAWLQYDNLEEGLIRVVNRGNDADTVGAVAGALFGAYNGINDIPKRWIKFKHNEKIKEFAEFAVKQW
jgi:ADP-ribosyl-[dinitrogen reductase] hydrolase